MFEQSDLNSIPGIEAVQASFNGSDGGFKQVYACTVNGKKNAVKVTKVADRNGVNDTTIQRLRRELDLLGALTSPYLPKLGDLPVQRFDKDGSVFIIYSEDFIEGADVSELIANHTFNDPAKITKLIHDVCSALKIYWGHQQTIHRDVKPANIRFSNISSDFILIDAGIALIKERTTITPSGQGSPRTPSYTAPEIIKSDRNISFRTDLFCLGIVAYEAATGEHPFLQPSMTINQLYDAILKNEPAPIADSRTDLPPEVDSLIMKMLRKRPHQRPNSLDAIINMGSTS